MYLNPSEIQRRMKRIKPIKSRTTVYKYIDFIKKNTGPGKRYPENSILFRPGIGQNIEFLAFMDAYIWKKAVEIGYAPPYDPQEMKNYVVKAGAADY